MKVKTILNVISSAILLASLGAAFAANSPGCPDISSVRKDGSSFAFAKLVDGWDWALISQPFNYADVQWQTTFTVNLPNLMDPEVAISVGSDMFKRTPFATQPAQAVFGNKTICTYTQKGSPISLVVSSPVEWGLS